jgi:pentatricopeptide repeat protein
MLHTLRASLGQPSALRGNPLRIDGDFATSDVAEFRTALNAGDLERAVELYRGPFLDGFYVSGLPEFDEWLESERALLAARYSSALERLATDATARGHHNRAVQYLRALGSALPLSGRVTCQLMRALAASGDRDGALGAATHYAVRVREQLGVEPEPSVTALAEELRAQAPVNQAQKSEAERPIAPDHAQQREHVRPLSAPHERVTERRETIRRTLFLIGGAAIVLLAAAAWFAVKAPVLDQKRVLVGTFEDRTGDPALSGLVRLAATEIVSGLASTGLVQPIDAATVTAAGDRARDFPSLRLLARRVGAGSVVSGSVTRRGDSLEFLIHFTDTKRGDLLRPVRPVVSLTKDPTAAVDRVAQRVMAGYGAHFDPRFHNYATVSQPATYAAYREFQAAVKLHNDGGGKQWGDSAYAAAVLEHLYRAIAIDSSFIAPRVWVGIVRRWELVDCRVLDSIASELRTSATHLLSSDQATLDLHGCHVAHVRYDAARQLFQDAPGLADNVYFLSWAALDDHRPREVLSCLERLERTQHDKSWRADCWNLMMHAYHELGEYREALQLIDRMRVEFPEDPLLERYQMRQWAALGDIDRVNALMDLRIRKSSEWYPAGEDMLWIGEELRGHGHRAAGKGLCERGIAWFASQPTRRQTNSRWTVAQLLYCAERWDQARVVFEDIAPNDSPWLGLFSGIDIRVRLAAIAARRGDSAEVARMDRWFAARDTIPRAAYGRAVLASFRGDWVHALAFFQFGWDRGEPGQEEAHYDPVMETLRDYPPIRALIYAAR